jgi:hypothetical protein
VAEISWQDSNAQYLLCNTYVPGENHPLSLREDHFSSLSIQTLQYQAKGDLLLLGDFNARLGDHTGDDKINGNADLMKEFMSSALHDGASGQFKCVLNAS